MIHEVIVTTKDSKDKIHIAPMGIRWLNDNHDSKKIIISPFKPSTTLDNLMVPGCPVQCPNCANLNMLNLKGHIQMSLIF